MGPLLRGHTLPEALSIGVNAPHQSLALVFLASALYHSVPHPPRMRILILAGILLFVVLNVVLALPCSQTSQILMGKHMALQIVDSALLARPVDSTGKMVTDSVHISISLTSAVERVRTIYEGELTCRYPHSIAPWDSGLTVNSTSYDGDLYGAVINYVDIEAMNCEATFDKIVHNGVNVSRIRMTYSSPDSNLRLETLLELPDGSTTKESYDRTNYTTGNKVYSTYYEYVDAVVSHTRGAKKKKKVAMPRAPLGGSLFPFPRLSFPLLRVTIALLLAFSFRNAFLTHVELSIRCVLRRKDVAKISWTGSNYNWTNSQETFLVLYNNLTGTEPLQKPVSTLQVLFKAH